MRMKTTKALLFCSFTIVLLLGVVGIASAAPPGDDSYWCKPCGDGCPCGDMFNTHDHFSPPPPFCWGHPKDFARGRSGNARLAAACLVECVQVAPKGNQ